MSRPDDVPAGVVHEVDGFWVHVPATYDETTPANLMFFLDGQGFLDPDDDMRAGAVLDDLIHAGDLQQAHHDLGWNEPEDNWLATNLRMTAALLEASYDVRLVLGDGGHDSVDSGRVLPEALRWLFRD